ncbi:hypothetical protein CLV31_108201 [Algoriphagus aquaeductus]|uniref:Uncharacterized protein n=1 Tax=Algoriphagus aquaeductus TaxID=475299 RepID=A0A326RNP4_9BACT|nr:hypothetical protein [Algoriphagus aquaeductus]PZV83000.1 hypothetical protein CLV31_108201 [Algoriphagus aquaeductus]
MLKVRIKEFSLVNVLPALLASLLSISIVTTINFFNIPMNEYFSILVIFTVPVFIMHGICYLDNRKVNNTLGRIFQDILFVCVLFLLASLSLNITNQFYKIGSSLNLITIIIFSTIISELIFILTVALPLKLKRR